MEFNADTEDHGLDRNDELKEGHLEVFIYGQQLKLCPSTSNIAGELFWRTIAQQEYRMPPGPKLAKSPPPTTTLLSTHYTPQK